MNVKIVRKPTLGKGCPRTLQRNTTSLESPNLQSFNFCATFGAIGA